jgi:excinuclease ABC subunit C
MAPRPRPDASPRTPRAEADAVEQGWQADLAQLDTEPEPTDELESSPLNEVVPGSVADSDTSEFDFAERLRTAPDRPGCYLMKDRQGRVIYVGKASSLRARLRQYASGQDERFFVDLLDHVLGSIELVVTTSEKDALLLENDLIKRLQPRFNVKLKDDKRFLHLRIAGDQDFPRLQVVRRPARDGAQYFGPYASASAARATLQQINRWFQLRTCADSVFRNRTRPCLEYQIHRCPGPCVLPVDPADYAGHVRDVTLFLQGRRSELVDRLKARMLEAADAEDFERAARFRDQVAAIEQSLERTQVDLLKQRRHVDALGLYREGARICVSVLSFREGALAGSQGHVLKDQEWPDAEVVAGFAQQLYDRGQPVPDELLVPTDLPGADALADWLTDVRQTRAGLDAKGHGKGQVAVTHPQRGWKAGVLQLAADNARQVFEERVRVHNVAEQTLAGLQQRLHLSRLPRRIECYDISNIQGTDPVGSMVVFQDGQPCKAEYRHFAVRSKDTPDDFAMMYEVLSRRFARLRDDRDRTPDLIVIDGGRGQLKMALAAMADAGVGGIELCGLAKARTLEADDHGPSRSSPERVFRPGQKNPIVMPQTSSEVFLLTHIRDEAHRFAITFHRQRRDKRTLRSQLDVIAGVGPARRKALLQAFGSLKGVRAASQEAIAAVPGIGAATAARIVKALGGGGQAGA